LDIKPVGKGGTVGEFVRVDVSESGVATLRLDRPKVNALNEKLATEIGEAVDELATNEKARAVVVWGGERVFAAGADIKEMESLDATSMFRYIGRFQDVFTRLERLPQPTIAAINGYALGGGCELSLACDFRICAEDSQLGQPEIKLGVIPGAGGTQRLPRLVGPARAKDIIFSGRFVSADEALRIGLVDNVVSADKVYETAVETAELYARGPSVALMAAKQAIDNGLETDLATGLLIERQAFAALFASEDQKIGMRAFVDKSEAKFVGR
jgi:enoyl-CoA hydratase/carnithine racemase